MENPYPHDYTIKRFTTLYSDFIASAYRELTTTRNNVKKVEEKLDLADKAMKAFENNLSGRIGTIIRMLPTSKCPFCGGVVVDKTPLKQFVNMFKPSGDEENKYWQDFWMESHIRFRPECMSCGLYQVSELEFTRQGIKKWRYETKRKPFFIDQIFLKYPFVITVAGTGMTSDWFLEFPAHQIWRIDGKKEEVIRILGLPSNSEFVDGDDKNT